MARHPLLRRKTLTQIYRDIERERSDEAYYGLSRHLGVRDLTILGIAAIIGAGIFSTVGEAAASGGPAVALLFVGTAVACGFAALCYAEFASAIPISGSAYTYAYASFGELIAWIIGWDLLVEYAIGNITVAISWSDYLTGFLQGFGIEIPPWATTDYLTATRLHEEVNGILQNAGQGMQDAVAAFKADPTLQHLKAVAEGEVGARMAEAWAAWETAPQILGFHMIFDVPAVLIVIAITAIVYIGIRESRTTSNILVGIKMAVIFLVILVGVFYVEPNNWQPFAPESFGGVMQGVAAVFFAYIGFDSISTTAEECKNPQRDLPRAMMYCLAICTVLYVIVALVLTGLVPYNELAVGDPMAYAIRRSSLPPGWGDALSGLVALGAIIATTSVLLVFQMGQPRILMSMSRDGLLPAPFRRIHPRFRTPGFSTIVTGFMVAIPCFFMNLSEVTDLTSIGTLFAFVLVCGGVLVQQVTAGEDYQPTFKVFYINGKYILPLLLLLVGAVLLWYNPGGVERFFALGSAEQGFWAALGDRTPYFIFMIAAVTLAILTFRWDLSLLPGMGLLTCLYLMAEIDANSWFRFFGWLILGLIIYFWYSRRNSRLAHDASADAE